MRRLSILIADDAPEVCALLSRWLHAHHSVCVHSGTEALKALTLLHFDLVITDIHMPDVTELDVISRLKQRQPWVKVLAISGGSRLRSTDDYLTYASEAGADGIVMKPFDEDGLLVAVRACWEKDTRYEQPWGSANVSARVPI